MKRLFNWQIVVGLILVGLSVMFYFFHYLLFHDLHHILLYLMGDIAFLFLDVLIVMLVLHRLLAYREEKLIQKKLNVIIGVFFSEVGTELLRKISRHDSKLSELGRGLVITNDWTEKEYGRAKLLLKQYEGGLEGIREGLDEIKAFLAGQRPFMLRLLENPNLLEHESFTNLLWAVFHLTDELAHRREVKKTSECDYRHLTGDAQRVYRQLIWQWLEHLKYLGHDYPYLFSLAVRTNPFDLNASVEVK